MKKEVINLERTEESIDADSLSGLVPETSPRYHLFSFKHTHEGDYQEAVGTFTYTDSSTCILCRTGCMYSNLPQHRLHSLNGSHVSCGDL